MLPAQASQPTAAVLLAGVPAGAGTCLGTGTALAREVVVCRRKERYELIDGFKRLGAARMLASLSRLEARRRKATVVSGMKMFRQLLGNECALLSSFL
jgi:hypothetical protein